MRERGFVVVTLDMEPNGTVHVHCPQGHRYDVEPMGEVKVSEGGNLFEADYPNSVDACKVCGTAL